jgi:Uma2 family endonuclease
MQVFGFSGRHLAEGVQAGSPAKQRAIPERFATRRDGGEMTTVIKDIVYPTSDGRPMAETDWHRDIMYALIKVLQSFYTANSNVYVSGNLLLYYVPGDKRRHISPDVFVVKGVPNHPRPYYLLWEEKKRPNLVIEVTSSSTRSEDMKKKFLLYQDVLKVQEYFLFDPFEEYLEPSFQGYRLRQGKYVPIRPAGGRLPSAILGLQLERDGLDLRLFDPKADKWLPTPEERIAQTEAEVERLQRQLETLRRQTKG